MPSCVPTKRKTGPTRRSIALPLLMHGRWQRLIGWNGWLLDFENWESIRRSCRSWHTLRVGSPLGVCMKRGIFGTLAGVVAVGLAFGTSSGVVGAQSNGDSADKVVFTVGNTQDIDSLNVNSGVFVIDYEIWNITLPSLTGKAAADFSITPSLAESWTASDDGLTYTYTLVDGAKWSDGKPLTADDVVFTINRSVEEQWSAYTGVTGNLTATATDARTVVVTSSVPDPRLPIIDSYILPKHIYEPLSAEEVLTYPADDFVSGGPFMIAEKVEGEFVRLVRNPNWYGKKPAIDEVVFRLFATPEAQYNALKAGDLDAVNDVPEQVYNTLTDTGDIVRASGTQGSFSELGMNNSCPTGIGDGHPALTDRTVRQAINWAIDRQALVDQVLDGNATVSMGIVPSADPAWDLIVPKAEQYSYDPVKAKALLDEAGWIDANGDGVREKDGLDLKLRYFDRSTGGATDTTEFLVGWLKDVGIATEVETFDEDTLTAILGKGEYDLFTWGWVPFVDPDATLSYFLTEQVTTDPDAAGYNDANWCNAEYDALYAKQHVELDVTKRKAIVQQMLRVFYDEAPYAVLYKYNELQAIRADRWDGIAESRQPAKIGPVLFNNSSPAYVTLRPKGAAASGGGDGGIGLGVVIPVVVLLGAVGAFVVLRGRRRKDDDSRE
jgi:peptide/nickel transport system substrate-binding protein